MNAPADPGPEWTPAQWKSLIRRHAIRPDKALGQHFLLDPIWLSRIVQAADLTGTDRVLEIGAGIGTLTNALARHGIRVWAVEIDRRLLPALNEAAVHLGGVEVVFGDVLVLDLDSLVGRNAYKVVANIPYNITSALMRRLLEAPRKPTIVVLTIQREVAERVMAQPGDMSLLALSVQIYGRPSIQGWIPAEAFYPPPKVESAILRIDIHETPLIEEKMVGPVFQMAKAGFGQRRKQLHNALAGGLGIESVPVKAALEAAGLPRKVRAQELSPSDWLKLARTGLLSAG